MDITLSDYGVGDEGGFGSSSEAELQKAMQAGHITGRDTTGLPLTQQPLKVESLDKSLKLLEYRTQDIKLWNSITKIPAYNTVEEFLQLQSYGEDRGGFYDEGELSDVEDSTYVRRAERVKYIQVTGEVTMQAQIVTSFVPAMRQEINNKMMWIQRKANKSLTTANEDIIPQEFNGFYAQHASIGSETGRLYSTYEQYYRSGLVIDLRGKSLKQEHVELGAVTVSDNYGSPNQLFGPISVMSAFSIDYYERQRITIGANAANNKMAGTPIETVATTQGQIGLNSDKFMKADPAATIATQGTSVKAPPAPTAGATPVAMIADANVKYSGSELGTVFYAVAAKNKYGQSAITLLGNSAVTLTAGQAVDLSFSATSGSFPTQAFIIYRTKLTTAPTPGTETFYPIYQVSASSLSAGHNGAAATKTRDLGYFLPDCEKAFLAQLDDEVLAFKQLAPMSKLDLAVLGPSNRFIVFLFGTPQLFAPKKLVRYINVGKTYA